VLEDLGVEVEVFGDDRLGGVGWERVLSVYTVPSKHRSIPSTLIMSVDDLGGGCENSPSQSVRIKVDSSEKWPSSKMSRNSVPFSPRPCREWGTPLGKYHRSPFLRSSMKLPPS